MANRDTELPVHRGNPPGAPAPPASGTETYGRWAEQMQRSRGRHAAITRNLYTWSNYKNWADKVRNNWEPESGK